MPRPTKIVTHSDPKSFADTVNGKRGIDQAIANGVKKVLKGGKK